MKGVATVCEGTVVVCRQRGLPGVHSPSGGRSWKRWQEHLSVHSSAMQRKLSNNLSDSSLSGRLSDSAARKATAPGQPFART